MRIAKSSITMTSARQYSQIGAKGRASVNKKDFYESAQDAINAGVDPGKDSDTYKRSTEDDLKDSGIYSINTGRSFEVPSAAAPKASQFQNDILSLLIQRLMSRLTGNGPSQQITTYSEYETTEFHAHGNAITEDGRSIDFSVDIMMSRSYMEYTNIPIPSIRNALCDPLVINTGSATADISDQKFFFDIDADGEEDEISMPGTGSGFLALDKNGDGVINDGSELFGAKSGDGFADLREYDSDGNGWIDENDDIFSKLKVWCKGEDGEDILMDLKEADIGAIYLGAQQTEFTMSGMDGVRDGVIRSTGLFLRESLGVGTIQHVDLAKGSASVLYTEDIAIEKLVNGEYHPRISTSKNTTVNDTDPENLPDKEADRIQKSSSSREQELEERVKRRKATEKLLKETQEKQRRNKLLEKEQFEKKLYQERAQKKAWQRRKAMRDYLYTDSPENLSNTVSYA